MDSLNPTSNEQKETILLSPKFSSRSGFKGRILCQISSVSSSTKNLSRAKFEKISIIENFWDFLKA